MNVNRISPQAFSRRSEARVLARGTARERALHFCALHFSPQAFSRRSEARVLALSPTRTFTKGAHIMSVNHILTCLPAQTLVEGGNAS